MTIRPMMTLLTTTALLTLSTIANAADPADVAQRLKDIVAGSGLELTWSAVDGDDSKATLRGASIRGEPNLPAVSIGEIRLEGIEDGDGDDLIVETLSVDRVASDAEGMTYTLEGVEISGLILPSPQSADPITQGGIFDSIAIASGSVAMGASRVFSFSDLSGEMELHDDGKGYDYEVAVDSFAADLTDVADAKTLAILTALNLAKPTGSFEGSGSGSLSTGISALDRADYTIDGAGTLGLSLALGGYTEELMKAARDMQKAALEGGSGADTGAQGMAMLGLLQQLTLVKATIRYDDEALAGRALDMAGGMQGMKRSDMVGLTRMMLPGILDKYVPAAFAQQVSGELAKFIEDPKSIEIRAAPANPVPFAILGMAIVAPQGLPDQLALKVSANSEPAE